jgi:hypothetical protein
VTRALPHPRALTTDLRAAALLLIRRTYSEAVRMLGHTDPIAVALWELGSAEERHLVARRKRTCRAPRPERL